MTALVTLEKVTRRLAEKVVLDAITLGIHEGERVGVIGVNGSGKSTLLRLIAGVDEPDSGSVVTGNAVRVRYLAQDPVLDPAMPALEIVAAAAPALHEAEAILDRLGIADPAQPVGALSGGQRRRVALARTLVEPCDLLVLDEPTNHLDVDVVEWLEAHLGGRAGALVMVTHDRYLLDRTATRIVEVHRGGLHTHQGGYGSYLEARVLREAQAAATERRRQNRLRTELAWLRRSPAARTSKAGFRVEQAQALLEQDAPAVGRPVTIDLAPGRRLGGKVVHLHGAGKRWGDRWVVRGMEHRIGPGDRLGLVGPNGSGKTTLLGLIAGRLVPDEGSVSLGETVQVGWYGQDPEPLPPALRVIDAVDEVARRTRLRSGRTVTAGGLLELFLFDAAAQRARIPELSGGERRRLELIRVLAAAPNVLLLDEPTNDLDLDTLAVLEDYLDTWPGTLVVATHDRFFLDRACDDVFSLTGHGAVRHHPGGWTAYRRWQAQQAAAAGASRRQRAADPPPGPSAAQVPPRPTQPRKLGFNEQRELAALDQRIPELERRKAALTQALAGAGEDYPRAQRLATELSAVLDDLAACEERWLELMAILEEAR